MSDLAISAPTIPRRHYTIRPAHTEVRPRILCLSTYFSTDRILLYSSFLNALERAVDPVVWSNATSEPGFASSGALSAHFAPFGSSDSLPEYLSVVRHFVDYAWDHTLDAASRQSFWRLRRGSAASWRERLLYAAAKPLSAMRLAPWLERQLARVILRYGARPQLSEAVARARPSLLFAMTPFRPQQMAMVAAARRLGIPVVAFITSWDNLTTKTRLLFEYDGYVVWSDQMKKELQEYHPQSRRRPVYVVGAPQYDVFFDERFARTRATFLASCGLNPQLPVVAYCMGSPNLIREDHGARAFLERLDADGDLSRVQVIVRPHPGFHESGYTELEYIRQRFPSVVVQSPQRHWNTSAFQPDDSITEWVNTIRHADVVINLSSTVAIDAAICERPVINLDFDPEPGQPNQQLVREINHQWTHFRPIAESGGVWLVNNYDEMHLALRRYLAEPQLHRERRAWIAHRIAGLTDGRAGERMAAAVMDVLKSNHQRPRSEPPGMAGAPCCKDEE